MHKSVLIVDDDQDIRDAFTLALKFMGYSVFAAENGQAALQLLAEREPPCVILLDMMMPVMNGEEFRKRQLADPALSKIPVVVVTADRDARAKAHAIGVPEGVAKPVHFNVLCGLVSKYCGKAV